MYVARVKVTALAITSVSLLYGVLLLQPFVAIVVMVVAIIIIIIAGNTI